MSTTDNNNDQRGGGMKSNTNECTSCEQNNVDDITNDIDNIAIKDDKKSTCANCGKEDNSNDMNICNRCKMVKYCNAACKKKHRSKHKKKCDRHVAELYDEQLFKDHPPNEECPICMIPLPIDSGDINFQACCGRLICNGCIYAYNFIILGKDLCPFCRKPQPEEDTKHVKKLMDKGNAYAYSILGSCYHDGVSGVQQDWHPQDYQKANELFLKAGELGCADGYFNLGQAFRFGRGVEVNNKKAKHYYELAAMNGHIDARHKLGVVEAQECNNHRAMKHFIIAAKAGRDKSLAVVLKGIMHGDVTKEEYAHTLRAYQKRQQEIKSDEREKAAKYFEMMGV